MKRRITGFYEDVEGHFVAMLECGHEQHVRHKPPLVERPWVLTAEGRASRIGQLLDCPFCDETDEDDDATSSAGEEE
ncbi:MAG: DUF3565 domain-containing protein [Hyphomicrobiaceae bacterium]|nr:DUF3565 domain-containing protein [Hyphomicrobiaceae bacterium]